MTWSTWVVICKWSSPNRMRQERLGTTSILKDVPFSLLHCIRISLVPTVFSWAWTSTTVAAIGFSSDWYLSCGCLEATRSPWVPLTSQTEQQLSNGRGSFSPTETAVAALSSSRQTKQSALWIFNGEFAINGSLVWCCDQRLGLGRCKLSVLPDCFTSSLLALGALVEH